MSIITFLAQQETQADPVTSAAATPMDILRRMFTNMDILLHPDELLDALAGVSFVLASTLVIVGVLCVFNGYRWHRLVVVVLAFFCGLGMGELLADQFGRSNMVAIALGSLCAIVATPRCSPTFPTTRTRRPSLKLRVIPGNA